jgi:hypothetical protein
LGEVDLQILQILKKISHKDKFEAITVADFLNEDGKPATAICFEGDLMSGW